MKKSEIRNIAVEFGLAPNKKLGQNFLINSRITDLIICAVKLNENDSILEIGPGFGTLTDILLKSVRNVTAVEIDSGLVRYLRHRYINQGNLRLIHGDFLKCDIRDNFTKVISNLPYYCSSEILFRIALNYCVDDVFVMLQREMAERIVSRVGKKSYGALSVTIGFYFEPEIQFHVGRKAFYPVPDISSSFIRFKRKKDLVLKDDEIVLFHKVVKSAFWGRRKTMLKALAKSPYLDFKRDRLELILKKTGIDPNIRGENLSIKDYIDLVKQFNE